MKKTIQKWLAVFLAATILCGTMPFAGITAAAAVIDGTVGTVYWTLDTETGVLRFTGTGAVPSSFGPRKLTIEGEAYDCADTVRKIEFSEGIDSLGSFEFSYYPQLRDVYLPATLRTLSGHYLGLTKDAVFHLAANSPYLRQDESGVLYSGDGSTLIRAPRTITSAYMIPDTVQTIDENAFSMCTGLTKAVIPDSVKTIGSRAFYLCSKLAEITIGSGVQTISDHVFASCAVTSIYIPAGVHTIDKSAFESMFSVKMFEVDAQNPNYACADGVLTDKDVTTILAYPLGAVRTDYTVPDTVQTIEARAFSSVRNLETITLSPSVRSLGSSAFSYAKKLTRITIPEGLRSIGCNCFYDTPLTQIELPNTVKTIEWSAFAYTALESIVIPGSVDDLSHLFSGCKKLRTVILRSGVMTVDLTAFANLGALETVHIPSTVKSIGARAFERTAGAAICSDSADCEASRFAQEKGIAFSVCSHEPECAEHDYVQNDRLEPTCTTAGYTQYVCKTCGNIKKDVIEATGHSFGTWTIYDNAHRAVCGKCGRTYQYAHNYTPEVTQEATCTEKGVCTYTCAECGRSYTEDIPALGHDMKAETTDATCEEDGVMTKSCTRCDLTEQTVIPATGHNWKELWRTEPTCTEPGSAAYRCENCGECKTDELAPLGHDCPAFLTEWTASTHTMNCTRCGETISGPHDLKVTHEIAATCTRDGEKTFTCDVCGYVNSRPVPRLGHDFGEWQPMEDDNECHGRVCARCGDEEQDEHCFRIETVQPTCTKEGKKTGVCTVCGYSFTEMIPPTDHDFLEDVTYPTCEEEGVRNRYCPDCGLRTKEILPPIGHDWKADDTVPATCTQDGHTDYVCQNNSRHKKSEIIPATGHNYDSAVYPATCTEGAKTVFTCHACGDSYAVYDPEHPSLGHSFGEWTRIDGEERRTCARCGETESRPIPTAPYTVRVIRMNTEGVYAEPAEYTRTGVIGEAVSVDANDYLTAGWTLNEARSKLSDTLAEAGTTLVVTLDRVKITVRYLLPDMTTPGEQTVYAQDEVYFGAQIMPPLAPESDGWEFLGWFTADDEIFTGAQAGTEDLTICGKVEAIDPDDVPSDEELAALNAAICRLPDPENLYYYKDAAILRVAAALNSAETDADAFIEEACTHGYALAGAVTKKTVRKAIKALEALLDVTNETALNYTTEDGAVWREESKAEMDIRVVPVSVNGTPVQEGDTAEVRAGDRVTFAVRMRTGYYVSAADIPIVFDAKRFYIVDQNGDLFTYDEHPKAGVNSALALIASEAVSTQGVDKALAANYSVGCYTVDSPEGQYPEACRTAAYMQQYKILHLQVCPNVSKTMVPQKLTQENGLLCTFTLQARSDAKFDETVSEVGALQSWYKTASDDDTLFYVTRAAGLRSDGVTSALHGTGSIFAFSVYDIYAQYGQTVTAQTGAVRFTKSSAPPGPVCVHNFVLSASAEPTEQEDGYKLYTCTLCGETEKEIVPYTGALLEVTASTATPGGVVEAQIRIRNNPGIISTRLYIEYDPTVLKLDKVENGEIFFRHEAAVEGSERDQIPYVLFMTDALNPENYTQDGLLATLVFSVLCDAPLEPTQIGLSYDPASTFDTKYQTKEFAVRSVSMPVRLLYGDVDLDGELTLKDVVMIRRYLVQNHPEPQIRKCMDFFRDGSINNKDTVSLERFIAGGWDMPEQTQQDYTLPEDCPDEDTADVIDHGPMDCSGDMDGCDF